MEPSASGEPEGAAPHGTEREVRQPVEALALLLVLGLDGKDLGGEVRRCVALLATSDRHLDELLERGHDGGTGHAGDGPRPTVACGGSCWLMDSVVPEGAGGRTDPSTATTATASTDARARLTMTGRR